MKKRIISIVAVALALAAIMFGEYRFIMHNIVPYQYSDNCIRIEFFGIVDEYYCEDMLVPIRSTTSLFL